MASLDINASVTLNLDTATKALDDIVKLIDAATAAMERRDTGAANRLKGQVIESVRSIAREALAKASVDFVRGPPPFQLKADAKPFEDGLRKAAEEIEQFDLNKGQWITLPPGWEISRHAPYYHRVQSGDNVVEIGFGTYAEMIEYMAANEDETAKAIRGAASPPDLPAADVIVGDSPAFVVAAQSVRDLHALLLAGKENSKEYEAICEANEGTWRAMTESERERIRKLSEELYAKDGISNGANP